MRTSDRRTRPTSSLEVCRILLGIAAILLARDAVAEPLVSLEHHVVGARLRVSPEELFVPKTIPGSLMVEVVSASGSRAGLGGAARGTHVEAVLRGPSFPAYRLLGLPNEPLMLPPLALPGDYQIDDLRLVNTETGETTMMGSPSRVAVRVFPDVLVSSVQSRPLTIEEIQARGIVIDATNFSAVEFEAAFVIGGRRFPVTFPVVTPRFRSAVEIIPDAELRARLVEAERVNARLAETIDLPRELNTPGLNLQIRGVNFEKVPQDDEGERRPFGPPPIPGLVVIPGSIGFLNQFFSVQVFTANASPRGSGISVHSLRAQIVLPPGPDRQLGSDDDPLALARVGPEAETVSTLPILGLGRDGLAGTADDDVRLQPGQTGQAEFLVEGRRTGLHLFDIRLSGILDGFAHGEVPIEGQVSGSVMVRNPRFSMVFAHPRTIRTGEPYTAAVTIMNTSEIPANAVSVNLGQASLSGTELAPGQSPRVELGTIAPGESRTAEYRLVSRRTGYVQFSNLTGDLGLTGRFDLTLGVDERGVALSSDSIGYPDWVSVLPEGLRRAADRVLGQALSNATAATLPPGVRRITRATVERRVIELTEAGQRLRYGDGPSRVYLDLLLDWQGGRHPSLGFDQVLRETNAGGDFEQALIAALEAESVASGLDWLEARAADLAGRGDAWAIAASSSPGVAPRVTVDGVSMGQGQRDLLESGSYSGSGGFLVPVRAPSQREGEVLISFRAQAGQAPTQVGWFEVDGSGTGTRTVFTVQGHATEPACYRYLPLEDPDHVIVDQGCHLASSGRIDVGRSTLVEAAPSLISVHQDLAVHIARPWPFCGGPTFPWLGRNLIYENYGTLVAALFSKPISRTSAEAPGAFGLENGIGATGVALQPGGRVALINLRSPVGDFAERQLVAQGVTDERGTGLAVAARTISTLADQGVSVRGRVIGVAGEPVAGVPVTLTMDDRRATPLSCDAYSVRLSQVMTDAGGWFSFDFMPAGIGYTLGATDTRGLDPAAVAILLNASSDGELSADELQRIASDPMLSGAFRQAFSEVAVAEGVDRAVFKDRLPTGSPRIASEVPVVLRFRGRGTVRGTVFASDGTTPVSGVAVNLFPDQGSREQGRGVLTDRSGRFQFFGVPLGMFSLDARAGDDRRAIVTNRLATTGQVLEVPVLLTEAPVLMGSVEGVVLEDDAATPHPGARVMLSHGSQGVVGVATADATGTFRIAEVPAGSSNVAAVSFDGQRLGERRGLSVQPGVTSHVTLVLGGTAEVVGRVEFANGDAAARAIVAGWQGIVTANDQGVFHLSGVPLGPRRIAAALERDPSRNIEFTRVGSAELQVLPGTNHVVVRLSTAGRIAGHVLTADGAPVANVRVAVPSGEGFYWTDANAEGYYGFDNIGLGAHLVSAPAPPVQGQPPGQGVALTDSEALLAASVDAFTLYASGFARTPHNPGSWGFTRTVLLQDGVTVTANVNYLRRGQVSGEVRNGNDVPIGAEVQLLGLVPNDRGLPTMGLVGGGMSDPATGLFSFGGLNVGDFTVAAASPFYPRPVRHSGRTEHQSPDVHGILLQFPWDRETNGRLTGTVLRDGVPAVGVEVRINFAPDYAISTNEEGRFDTQLHLPPRTYEIDILDASTLRRAFVNARVLAGATTDVTIPLLAADGSLAVIVRQANGAAAGGASLTIQRSGRPTVSDTATAGGEGAATFTSLTEGRYSVTGCWAPGQSRLCATRGVDVEPGAASTLTLTLGGSGTIAGRFVEADGTTAVGFAQIAVGEVGFTTTDASGDFSIEGVPLGTHTILGHNAVSGRSASAEGRLVVEGQTVQVLLREDLLGEITGRVIGPDGHSLLPGVDVTLRPSASLFPAVTVTTDPVGRFRFPGAPPGSFSMSAVWHTTMGQLIGNMNGLMPTPATLVEQDIQIPLQAELDVLVTTATGGPARAAVTVRGANNFRSVDTDGAGLAHFSALPLASYRVTARSLTEARSTGESNVLLSAPGERPQLTIALAPVGRVEGRVLAASGDPVANAQVTLRFADPLDGQHVTSTSFTSSQSASLGEFSFAGLPAGWFRVEAIQGALGAAREGSLALAGTATVTLTLGPSATVSGVLVRANGAPVAYADVAASYPSTSGLPGQALVRTDHQGHFLFQGVPAGDLTLRSVVPRFNGALRYTRQIEPHEDVVDLGAIALDEDDPEIVEVLPPTGATGVDVGATIEVVFSEPMDEFDPDTGGAYVTDGFSRVPVTLAWEGGNRLRILPASPLASETTYTIVVLAGDMYDNQAQVIGRGPRDMAERPLLAHFVSSFTTRDSIPPTIDSFTPADDAEQVAVDAVVRVVFSEPMDPANLRLELRRNGSVVTGTTSLGLNRRVAVFTPTQLLLANAEYVATLLGATDLAGNEVIGAPRSHTFATIDTLGPQIASLAAVGPSLLVATIAQFQVTLQAEEPGVEVRMSPDLSTFYSSGIDNRTVSIPLSAPGTLTLRAWAIDRFGNQGPPRVETFTVVSNLPPVVTLAQVAPAGLPGLVTGAPYAFQADATDATGTVELIAVSVEGAFEALREDPSVATLLLDGVVPSSLGPGSVIVRARAEDNLGEVGWAPPLELPLLDGVPPGLSVTFAPGAPAGEDLIVSVSASDAFGLAEVAFQSVGAVLGHDVDLFDPPVASHARDFLLHVPGSIPHGAEITLIVTARDAAGHVTTSSVTRQVSDITHPQVVSVFPAPGAAGVSLRPVVQVAFSEGVMSLSAASFHLVGPDGPVAATLSHVSGASIASLEPLQDLAGGTAYQIALTSQITDLAGNPLSSWMSGFTTGQPGDGPRLLSIEPPDDAEGVPLDASLRFAFSAPIDPLSVDPGVLTLEPEAGGASLPTTWRLESNDTALRFAPPWQGLQPGTSYAVRFGPPPADPLGFFVTDADGLEFAEIEARFTTSTVAVAVVGPPRAVEGLGVSVVIEASTNTRLDWAEWRIDGQVAGRSYGDRPDWRLALPSLASTPAGSVEIAAEVLVQSAGRFSLPAVDVELEPAADDFDGDGIPNGIEVAMGTDPWVSDATLDTDLDGRSNLLEIQQGTNPRSADTDHDGILDGSDSDPLVGLRRPGVGVAGASAVLRFEDQGEELRLPAVARLQPPFTLELWVNPQAAGGVVLDSGDQALQIAYDAAAGGFSFALTTVADGLIALPAQVAAGPGEWHHVSLSYDGVHRVWAFVDGNLVGTAVASGALAYATGPRTVVGAGLRGALHGLRLWTFARPAWAIQETMHRAVSSLHPGLFGDWRLDEGAGLVAMDATAPGDLQRAAELIQPIWEAGGASGVPLLHEPVAQVAGGQASIDLDAFCFDGPAELVVTSLPRHGRLLAGAPGSLSVVEDVPHVLGVSAASLVYEPRRGFRGWDRASVVARRGALASNEAVIRLGVPAAKVWVGGSATAPTAWDQAENWAPHGAPGSQDSVEIPAGAGPAITLTGDVVVGALYVGAGSALSLESRRLEVAGDLVSDGSVRGLGLVVASGSDAAIRGRFGALEVTGTVSLDGPLVVDGALSVPALALVAVGAHELTVRGNLAVGGALHMSSDSAVVRVEGSASFGPGGAPCGGSQPWAGTLHVGGDFSAGPCASGPGFRGDQTHTVILDGAASQAVHLLGAGDRFQNLRIRNPHGVTFGTPVVVAGLLVVEEGAMLIAAEDLRASEVELEANASLAATATLEIETSLVAGADSVISATSLRLDGTSNIAPGAQVSAVELHLGGVGASPVPPGMSFHHLAIGGLTSLNALLVVPGDLRVSPSGELQVGQHGAQVGGSLVVEGAIYSSLLGQIVVNGDIRFVRAPESSCATESLLLGVLVGRGDFEALSGHCVAEGSGFGVGDGQTTRLEGSEATVLLDTPSSARFGALSILGSVLLLSDVEAQQVLVTGTLEAGAHTVRSLSNLLVFAGGHLAARSAEASTVQIQLGGSVIVGETARFALIGASLGTLTAETLRVGTTSYGLPAGFTFDNLVVEGTLTPGRDVTVPGTVQVGTDPGSTAVLNIGSQRLTIGAALEVHGRVTMSSPTAEVDVAGDVLAAGQCGSGSLTNGIVRVGGSWVSPPLTCGLGASSPADAHTVVFDGRHQIEQFVSRGWFGTMRVAAGAQAVVTGDWTYARVLELEVGAEVSGADLGISYGGSVSSAVGSQLVVDHLNIGAAVTVETDGLVAPLLTTVASAVLPDWNYNHLAVVGSNVALSGDRVVAGNLAVPWLHWPQVSLDLAGHRLEVGGNVTASGLRMTQAAGELVVGGDLSLVSGDWEPDGPPCGQTGTCCLPVQFDLSAGVIRLAGDLTVEVCSDPNPPSLGTPGLGHRFVFEGSGPQTVTFSVAGGVGRFGDLEVAGGASVSLGNSAAILGSLTIDGHLSLPAARLVEVAGSLSVSATGSLENDGQIDVAGQCQIDPNATLLGSGGLTCGP